MVVGNLTAQSRTLRAATRVARELTGVAPGVIVDVIDLGAGLFRWGDAAVLDAVARVSASRVLVVASPTYKATYTGILKLFLDQVPAGGLDGVVAIPLMLGASPLHALAPELSLKPVLVELGALCPTRAAFLIDHDFDVVGAPAGWLSSAREGLELLNVVDVRPT